MGRPVSHILPGIKDCMRRKWQVIGCEGSLILKREEPEYISSILSELKLDIMSVT